MYPFFKRLLDAGMALALTLLTAPLIGLLCVLIRLDSPGGAIFAQWRVGKGHRLFRMYKLRTMKAGAERETELLIEEGEIFVQRQEDPRLTRLGKFLRRTSLDELPQLWNVLKGEMAFVGPRPLVLGEMNRLPPMALERLDVRPGITGYAQAEGRSDANAVERISRDLYYVRNLSFWLDLRILLHTAGAVWRREGSF